MPTPETASLFRSDRRMVAWTYNPVVSTDADGTRNGPTPFGSSLFTDQVPVTPGAQLLLHFFARWATGARPGLGLVKILLYPEFLPYYAAGTPIQPTATLGDRNNPPPVLAANTNTRVAIGPAYNNAISITPMKYRPKTIAPTAAIADQIIETELVLDRIGIRRSADSGGVYNQQLAFFLPSHGIEPHTFGTGATPPLAQAPREVSFRFRIDWEGTGEANDPANPPFITNDAISILMRIGANAPGR